jgi:hypothetical protein
MYGKDDAASDPKSKGGEPAKTGWVPKSIYGLPIREFQFVLDPRQRMQVKVAIDLLLAELHSSSRRFAIYGLCTLYCGNSRPSKYVDPKHSRRLEPGRRAPKHLDELHADQVQDAIDLAIERGCEDAGHALAHIALSFVAFSGWDGRVGKQQPLATHRAPKDGQS